MKRKITAILVTILFCSVSATVAFAAKPEWLPAIIPPYPRPSYPDVKIAKGVAVDKSTLETEPVVFLIMNYRGEVSTYLFIDGKFYEMTEIERSDGWETGTKVFKYKANDDSIITVVIQHFDPYDTISIVADFKNYLINFEPINKYGPRPLETGVTERPVYEEVMKKLKKIQGIDIQEIFDKPAGQITEWIE